MQVELIVTTNVTTNSVLEVELHSKITMTGEVVPYYTVTALVPTLK